MTPPDDGTRQTGDPLGARAHARAQGGTSVQTMPILPAADAPDWPEGAPVDDRLWAETIGGGNYTSLTVARGTQLEFTDLTGDGCVHLALFNAVLPDERLNVADTIKVQWQAYPTEGSLLLSDRGRALATIVVDTSGRHDTFAGTSTARANEARYGDGSPHGGSPAGRELLILAAAKQGLAPRDLPPTFDLFQGVRVQDDGELVFEGGAGAGARVVLRAELPLIVLAAVVPHPLDPAPGYRTGPVRLRAWRGEAADAQTPVATATPEAGRAVANTIAFAGLRGLA